MGNMYTWYVNFIQIQLVQRLFCIVYLLGAFPYPLLSNRDVVRAVLNGERLESPPNCTEDL